MRADRLMSLLLLLQAHGKLTAPDLARRLEVSVRTVMRDVEALSTAGVPVYAERGRGGGIVLLPGWRTDVAGLTEAEARALFSATGRGALPGTGAAAPFESALRKLLAAVPAASRRDLARSRERVLVDPAAWRSAPEPVPHLGALQDALWEQRRVVLRYEHGGRPPARRRLVDPWGLVSKNGTWYLVAASGGQPRMFRVSRVRAVTATAEPSACPDDLDLAAVWARLQEQVERTWGEVVPVRFEVLAGHADVVARVCAPQAVGAVREEPCAREGWRCLAADFRALGAARGVLLGFGPVVRVLDPPGLVADLLATARAVLDAYG